MGKFTLFQVIVMGIFGTFAVIGLILFATYSAKSKTNDMGRVIIWGTIDQNIMNKFLQKLRNDDLRYKKVLYKQYADYLFNDKVTDALAAGEGPDIIILKNEDLLKYKNKIYPISYETFSRRDFRDRFIDGAEIFMGKDAILAIPFAVDPMVLYYNRDIFADNMVVKPPKLWKEIPGLSAKMTVRDKANNIQTATIALGTYKNVTNAYAILSMLNMQVNSNITMYNPDNGDLKPGFYGSGLDNSVKAVKFYTAFANPVSNVYTWNRAMPESLEFFVQDRLAMYLGFVSDLPKILKKNPHLNFDVAEVPQVDRSDPSQQTRTYGRFWAFAITKASQNKRGAYNFTLNMLQPKYAKMLADMLKITYVQRGLLADYPDDPLKAVFRNSAIIAHTFITPSMKKTDDTLATMVANIISGQDLVSAAVSRAGMTILNIIDDYYSGS